MGAARVGRLAALAAAALLAVTGCQAEPAPPATEQVTEPIETASAAPAPSFASDEEALAAGVAALQAALDMEIEVSRSNGDLASLSSVAEGQYLQDLIAAGEKMRAQGVHAEGTMLATPIELQQAISTSEGVNVTFYTCVDASSAQKVDATGNPSPAASQPRLYMVATATGPAPSTLRIERLEIWSRDLSC